MVVGLHLWLFGFDGLVLRLVDLLQASVLCYVVFGRLAAG